VGVVDALTEWRARRWLSALSARLGTEGLAVAASVPGLAAAVDQHAAAVRDILAQGVNAGVFTDRVLLAGYGRGLLDRFDVSTEQVRTLVVGRWTSPDWLALRLLAVCALARSAEKPATRAYPGRSAAAR
jgi:hypothetical protein